MRKMVAVIVVVLSACGTAVEPGQPGVVGEWEAVAGTYQGDPFPLVDGFRITMNVEPGGTLGGTAACNGYGGTYVADGEDLIVDEIGATSMGCRPDVMESEQAFMSLLQTPLEYERSEDELIVRSDLGELRFTAVDPVPTEELIGTTWVLTSLIEGDTVETAGGERATLLLTEDGRIQGSTGCRMLSGEYVVNADQVLFTTFSATGQCPSGLAEQDGHVVTVLGDGFTVEIVGEHLTVTSSGDHIAYSWSFSSRG